MGGVDEGGRHRRLPRVDGFVKRTYKRTRRKRKREDAIEDFPKLMAL